MLKTDFFADVDKSTIDFYVQNVSVDDIETGIHQHKKSQLIYAEGGIVHIFINDKHWYLPARCFMWIPANIPHSILTYSKNSSLYNFYFKTSDEEDNFYSDTNIYFVNDLLREMFLFTKNWNGIILEDDKAKYNFLNAIKSILPEMDSNKLPISIQHPFPKDKKLIEIGRFLMNNIEKNYTIDEVAKLFGMSTRTLSRKFKESLGMNYVRFLRSLRVSKSFELIAENQYNMYEIAMMIGYNSLSAYSNIFYKVVGVRPSEYAQMLNKRKN
ncbi:AraC-like ligand binding domain-containing protein [Chishuiella changwenlii]|uniref:AraC family transcriptional regulator n=1 Tax=Chishuiella changwenlii TaxID=1434701 RepID=A0A1M7AKA1_9FLAO|nr:AraC family transcriptional regulator [Chishuiella changwenlii]GGE90555.1 AraC family transcriptional regulator [Chishuiella changwenlii]SHL43087.1 AraC-like ligand binding domain-containing protein [Chishuiella changwenlii]